MLKLSAESQLAFTMFLVSLKESETRFARNEELSLRADPFAKTAAPSSYLNSADQLRERERKTEGEREKKRYAEM